MYTLFVGWMSPGSISFDPYDRMGGPRVNRFQIHQKVSGSGMAHGRSHRLLHAWPQVYRYPVAYRGREGDIESSDRMPGYARRSWNVGVGAGGRNGSRPQIVKLGNANSTFMSDVHFEK